MTQPVNEKLKQTALYFLNNCPNIDSVGLKKLAKLLYFADFNYYKKTHQSITGSEYIRFEHGPFPDGFYDVIEDLQKEGKLEVSEVQLTDEMVQKRFTLSDDVEFEFISDEEKKQIKRVIEKLGDKTGKELEDLSHQDTPWQVSDDNERINYKLVFYRDDKVAKLVE